MQRGTLAKNEEGNATAEQCSIYTQNYKNQSSQHVALSQHIASS